jgi:hypothetical protein
MEKLFVEYEENGWNFILFFILVIITFGLAYLFLYDEFHERKYMINRRRLIKAIDNGEVTLVSKLPIDPKHNGYIEMFDVVDQNGNTYGLWLWTRGNGVIKATVDDHIGLFTGSLLAMRLNNKLVKTIKTKINK